MEKSYFISELTDGVRSLFELGGALQHDFFGHEMLRKLDFKYVIKEMPSRFIVDSNLIIAKDPKFLRLLSTDQCLVIPSKTPIRILVTSNDVIHS